MSKVKFKARTTDEIESLDIENGSVIYNTENGKTYLDYNDERIPTGGGAGGGVAIGDTPPENPEENDLWVDTNDEEHLAEVDDEVSTTSTNAVQNQAITNYVNGTVLYENASGSSSDIILNDSVSNYNKIDIVSAAPSGGSFDSYGVETTTIYPNISTKWVIMTNSFGSNWGSINRERMTISGTSLTRGTSYKFSASNGSVSTTFSPDTGNKAVIYKVIGYKI